MSRDHRKLRVFVLADELVIDVYRASASFPVSERYGLQIQLRRSAVSTASNIVEGCARRTEGEYLYFLNIAVGSAAEARYLASVSTRLKYVVLEKGQELEARYDQLCAGLKALISSLTPPETE